MSTLVRSRVQGQTYDIAGRLVGMLASFSSGWSVGPLFGVRSVGPFFGIWSVDQFLAGWSVGQFWAIMIVNYNYGNFNVVDLIFNLCHISFINKIIL